MSSTAQSAPQGAAALTLLDRDPGTGVGAILLSGSGRAVRRGVIRVGDLNRLFIQLSKRAERVDSAALIESFVDVGPLTSVLSTRDNQIVYGRRGTGKTHALKYLAERMREQGDVPVYVDLRTIGSTGGLYADASVPVPERATRLLVDTMTDLHEELLSLVLEDRSGLDLSVLGPRLDRLADAITEVVVGGAVRHEVAGERGATESAAVQAGVRLESASDSVVRWNDHLE